MRSGGGDETRSAGDKMRSGGEDKTRSGGGDKTRSGLNELINVFLTTFGIFFCISITLIERGIKIFLNIVTPKE